MKFTALEYEIFKHASKNGRFITGQYSDDWMTIAGMVAKGFLRDHGPQAIAGGDHCFTTTFAGRSWLNEIERNLHKFPERKPLSKRKQSAKDRYRKFLRLDFFNTFQEFLQSEYATQP